MTSSLTVAFSGESPVLQAHFLPEIVLDAEHDYSCALLDLTIKNATDLNHIINQSEIRVNCDIIFGSYINGERCHTIHQFTTSASKVNDQTLVEIPKNLNYLPLKIKNLHSIQITLVDSSGALIDTHSAKIICRIRIKREPIC